MTDATAHFFDELGRRGHEPLLEQATGTMRFAIRKGKRTDHFFLSIRKGDIVVSQADDEADCVISADRDLFNSFASGEKNLMTAFLRREVTAQGDPRLLVLFQRIFPGPLSSDEKSVTTSKERSPR